VKINEIFYSLQGEGYHVGTPAVFVRFAGCNLACPFCDTAHEGFTELTEQQILTEITQYPAHHVVLTGGEPTRQITSEFVNLLHEAGYYVQVETNGTLPVPQEVDWVTCSPKSVSPEFAEVIVKLNPHISEIKLLFMGDETDARIPNYAALPVKVHSLQPCDHTLACSDAQEVNELNAATLEACIDYIKANPIWRLSLQTHKLINIK
jgi:organic radical activating enzyme